MVITLGGCGCGVGGGGGGLAGGGGRLSVLPGVTYRPITITYTPPPTPFNFSRVPLVCPQVPKGGPDDLDNNNNCHI